MAASSLHGKPAKRASTPGLLANGADRERFAAMLRRCKAISDDLFAYALGVLDRLDAIDREFPEAPSGQ
jgi:hypothetical protein